VALLWFFTYTVTFLAEPGVRVVQFIEVTCWVQFLSQYIPNGPVVSTAETLEKRVLKGMCLTVSMISAVAIRRIRAVCLLFISCLAPRCTLGMCGDSDIFLSVVSIYGFLPCVSVSEGFSYVGFMCICVVYVDNNVY